MVALKKAKEDFHISKGNNKMITQALHSITRATYFES